MYNATHICGVLYRPFLAQPCGRVPCFVNPGLSGYLWNYPFNDESRAGGQRARNNFDSFHKHPQHQNDSRNSERENYHNNPLPGKANTRGEHPALDADGNICCNACCVGRPLRRSTSRSSWRIRSVRASTVASYRPSLTCSSSMAVWPLYT